MSDIKKKKEIIKYAKKFSNSWIPKLKEDMKRNNANFGLIVTLDLPKDIKKTEGCLSI